MPQSTPVRKCRFPLRKTRILSCSTKFCLWQADGDIRRAEHSPNIPPDDDPCPKKFALQTWKKNRRVGGQWHKQFALPEELLDQLVPSWLKFMQTQHTPINIFYNLKTIHLAIWRNQFCDFKKCICKRMALGWCLRSSIKLCKQCINWATHDTYLNSIFCNLQKCVHLSIWINSLCDLKKYIS